jgi:hypothetical protein
VDDQVKLTPLEVMDINRRFAVGARRIIRLKRGQADRANLSRENTDDLSPLEGAEEATQVELAAEDLKRIETCEVHVEDYIEKLKRLGIRDHQVIRLRWSSFGDLVSRSLYLVVMMALGILPQVLFNIPVMYLASRFAMSEQQKALKASSVKLAARDVVMSYKIIAILVLVPIMFVIYAVVLSLCVTCTITTKILILGSCPAFAFFGMKASEQGIREWKNIVPEFKRLFDGALQQDFSNLGRDRAALKKEVKLCVRKYGPLLGDLYKAKKVDWSKEIGELDFRAGDTDDFTARSRLTSSHARKGVTETGTLRLRETSTRSANAAS